MTQEDAIKWKKEIEAFQQGKTIQVFTRKWVDDDNPSFSLKSKYRVKPEQTKRQPTIKEVEKWFIENRVFILKSSNCMLRITSFTTTPYDLTEEYICIDVNWYTIQEFCKHFTHYDGSSLYITE